MTDSMISPPSSHVARTRNALRFARADELSAPAAPQLKSKSKPHQAFKGSLLAVVAFAAVYVATLVVLFAPRDMIQSAPQSFAAPIMSKTLTMPASLPVITAPAP